MPTNAYDTTRLNLQHLYYKMHTNYLLHPDIALTGTDLKVADVGTGTGYQRPNHEVQAETFSLTNHAVFGFWTWLALFRLSYNVTALIYQQTNFRVKNHCPRT